MKGRDTVNKQVKYHYARWSVGKSQARKGWEGPRGRRVTMLNGMDRKGGGPGGNYAALWAKSIPGIISFNPPTNPHQNPGRRSC